MATGKGTCRRAPITPFRTRGTVQQREPNMMQYTASRQVKPTARMAAGAIQPCAFRASENQNPNMVKALHVRRSRGVTSMSMFVLVHLSSAVFVFERALTSHLPLRMKTSASGGSILILRSSLSHLP